MRNLWFDNHKATKKPGFWQRPGVSPVLETRNMSVTPVSLLNCIFYISLIYAQNLIKIS